MSDPTCDKCGVPVLWVQCGTRRLPLDCRERTYRVTSSMGVPTVKQIAPILGTADAGGVDHRSVCKGVSP